MYLSTDGLELSINDKYILACEYQPAERGPGTVLFRLTRTDTYEFKDLRLRLDPWGPEGFKVERWDAAKACLICGADRILVISTESFAVTSVIPLEIEECETLGKPSFVHNNEYLFVVTEWRLFCLDARPAIRWCWSTKVVSKDWNQIVEIPEIKGDSIHLKIRSFNKEITVGLNVLFADRAHGLT